jgi:hypothetical protein
MVEGYFMFPGSMGKLSTFDLTHFVEANRYPLRVKMLALADPDSRFWPWVRLPSKLRTTTVTKTLRQEADGRF